MTVPNARYRPNRTPCGRTRREFLWQVGGGFAGLALIDLLSRDGFFPGEARAEEPDRGLEPAPRPALAFPREGEARRLPLHERRARARSTPSTPSPPSTGSTAPPTRARRPSAPTAGPSAA